MTPVGDSDSGRTQRRSGPLRAVVGMRRAWRRLSPFFRSSRSGIVLLVALAMVTGLAEAALLAIIATMAVSLAEGDQVITVGLGPVSVDMARNTTFAVAVGLAAARAGLQLALAYLPALMSSRVLTDLRIQLFEAFTASAWSVKAKERDGAFQTLMTQNVTNTAQAVTALGLGITAMIMFLTMTAAAFTQSFVAAAVFLTAALALFFVLRPLSRRLRRHAKMLSTEAMSFTNTVQEVVQVAEETEVFGATDTYRRDFREQSESVRRPYVRTRFLATGLPGLYQSVALLLLVLALIAISLSGTAQLASLAAVILMLIRALTYAQQIQSTLTGIDERIPFMHQIVDALERYRQEPQQDGDAPLGDVGDLALSHVSFAYNAESDVLHDVSFAVRRGEAIGIVGPSGAGKSTIVQILLRLRDPQSGAVLVNGQDVRGTRRVDWQARVSYVPQASQVVWGTVTDNIRFHRDWITDEQVVAAARRAHIHDDISAWPQGYDTLIGQRANAVSGGQRQRIALARALVAEPQVLVLDEPTSALDVRSEELVQRSLQAIKQDTIIILVAHRLSTLSVCDRIVVMVDGRVSAVGSHTDLMKQSDFFREVHEITARQGS
ncbi:ABC transporter ATP-binding protein [Ornithinimicrobium ciconiae]|uniref:ABC transporter ATP-binding protein n=1 Tax=Ornithinimicrobium ciconiae TaxID=2594265 RepID=A0A516G7E6_9MICO|nr:ABC transporter ATP-binding protein [Ornithinimicrobium ciconiae]QDO87429.1 ABC transporter ATP-binding protein [Ornithinimicrobium ciconiae]